MTADRLITINARRYSGDDALDVIAAPFGKPARTPRDRSGEAAYHEALNAHWRATEAKMDRVTGTHFEMLCRKMELIAEHDAWRDKQARLYARGQWMPCEMRDAA